MYKTATRVNGGFVGGRIILCVIALVSFGLAACSPSSAATVKKDDMLPPAARGLIPFFKDLYALENGGSPKQVAVVHLGDSHTAGGWFPNHLRKLFQEKFGDAGRGMMPPGKPYHYYRPYQATIDQSKHWKTINSFSKKARGVFGLSGYRLSSSEKDSWMSFKAEGPHGFTKALVEFVEQPRGGSFSIVVDGGEYKTVKTSGNGIQVRQVHITPDKASRTLEIKHLGGGPVDILSWTFLNGRPGIAYDSHGVVGASINIIGKWDPNVVAWELAHRKPSLIILEYGGNEGFHLDLKPEEYEVDFSNKLKLFQKAAPKASILIIGPSDGKRMPSYCIKKRDGNHGTDKKQSAAGDSGNNVPNEECFALSRDEIDNYLQLLENEDASLCRWHTPPNLEVVRTIQRGLAEKYGLPFWDWSKLMDEECGIRDWVTAEPSLAAKDHVHLQPRGYRLSADKLFSALMRYYAVYSDAMNKNRSKKK